MAASSKSSPTSTGECSLRLDCCIGGGHKKVLLVRRRRLLQVVVPSDIEPILVYRKSPSPCKGKALKEPNVVEFDITGKPMKGWVMVEPDGLDDDEQLGQWIQRAVEFVSTLPKK